MILHLKALFEYCGQLFVASRLWWYGTGQVWSRVMRQRLPPWWPRRKKHRDVIHFSILQFFSCLPCLQTALRQAGDDVRWRSIAESFSLSSLSIEDSAILRHLTSSPAYLSAVCKHGTHSHFTIQARARNKSHLAVLEAVYIAKLTSELCVQKKYVRKLSLFWHCSTVVPTVVWYW